MARVPLAILAIGVLLAAACGGEDAPADGILPQAPASIAQLIGPWQPQPFVLDPALRSRVEQACRRDMGLGPGNCRGARRRSWRRGRGGAHGRPGRGQVRRPGDRPPPGRDQRRGRRLVGKRRRAAGANRGDQARGSRIRVGRRRQPEGPGMVGDRARRPGHRIGRDRARGGPADPRHDSRTAGSPDGGLRTCRRTDSELLPRSRTSWYAATTRPERSSTRFAREQGGVPLHANRLIPRFIREERA